MYVDYIQILLSEVGLVDREIIEKCIVVDILVRIVDIFEGRTYVFLCLDQKLVYLLSTLLIHKK